MVDFRDRGRIEFMMMPNLHRDYLLVRSLALPKSMLRLPRDWIAGRIREIRRTVEDMTACQQYDALHERAERAWGPVIVPEPTCGCLWDRFRRPYGKGG